MAEEDLIADKTIHYEGIVDVKEVYEVLAQTFKTLGYAIDEGKQVLKAKAGKRAHEVEWDCKRNVDDYTRFLMCVTIKASDIKVADVKEGARTAKKETGRLKARFQAFIVTDYGGRWEGSPYFKFLKSFFDKFLYGRGGAPALARGAYKQWILKLSDDLDTVMSEVKALLHLYKV